MNSLGFMTSASADTPSWSDRWFALRNRLLASPLFRQRTASFFLSRPVARQQALSLFNLVAGFVYSQVLQACVRLDLFEILAEGPQRAEPLATRLQLSEEACRRLLAAAAALRLVEARGDGRYGLGMLGAPLVGNEPVLAMIRHHATLYADLADPVALLRGNATGSGQLAGYWPYAQASAPDALPAHQVADYSALMAASQPLVAGEILDAYPLHTHRCLLDVGGGEGAFLRQVASRSASLQLMLFDLPAVADRARARLSAAGLQDRATAFGGDFLTDALPAGADVISLVRVIHDHDDARVASLLRACAKALPPGGTLLLAEPMAQTPGAESMGAYFGFYLLAMGRGQPRTPARLTEMLHDAGFSHVKRLATHMPIQTQLLVARLG